MALGLPTNDGADRTPIVKYDARAGRLFRVDRTQSDGSWDTDTVEITPVFQAIMDLEHIELGWLYFPTNGAPEISVLPFGKGIPPKPSDKHRSGYRVHMLLGKASGGDVREMAANASISIKGMDALHDAYLEGVKAHPGQLPVVKLARTEAVPTPGKGADGSKVTSTNYKPIWEIIKWVDRPPELSAGHAAANGSGAPVTQARTTQQTAPDPEPEPVTPPSVEDDF